MQQRVAYGGCKSVQGTVYSVKFVFTMIIVGRFDAFVEPMPFDRRAV